MTSLCIVAIFIIWDAVRWAATQLCYQVIFQMGCCVFTGMPQLYNQEWIFHLCVLWYQQWSVFMLWRCIVRETFFFSTRWVPLHNDERKHNLIFTFIYRADCSNEVITISSALRLFLIRVLLLSLAANFGPIHSLKNACETMQMRTSEQMNVSWKLLWWENANEDEWVNECLMNACLMKRTY